MAPPAAAWQRLILWLILACWAGTAGAVLPVPKAANLAADGQLAHSTGQPVVILFSRTPCGWCDKARREHLDAMATQAAAQPGSALFRQIDLDSDAPLIDFSGQRTRHRDFARKNNVTMAPTLLFLGADGDNLAAPIVGYRLAEFYGTLIEDAIEDSRDRLRSNAK